MPKKPEIDQVSTLDIDAQGLGQCLESNFLSVPKYQRAFSWEEEDVSNFLTDINTAFAASSAEYFMGAVVLQGADKKFEVVDGQQRLTTATIFIASVRDFLRQKSIPDVAQSLEDQFLLTKDTWTQQVRPKLTLSVYDNDFFLKCILGGATETASRESHERLLGARTKCLEFLTRVGEDFSNWFERIQKLVEYVERKVRVIQVRVPTQANAYVIFETLNDRGKELSAADLLKNHLFGRAEERVDEVQARWNQMLGILEAHGGDEIVITYIRQLWSATRELAREKELFSKIKDKIVTPQQAVDFANELLARADHYSAMLNPAHGHWKVLGGNAGSIVEALNNLKVERYRPALLALLARFQGPELVRAMRYILNSSVRYLIAVGAGGGTLEAAWSDVARKVTLKTVTNVKQFSTAMQHIIPNDEVFRASFSTARVSKSYLARYFLASLERYKRGEKNSELVPNADVASVNLEHVLPEALGTHWPHIHPDLAAALWRRLGNQVLMSSKLNSQIGNAPFEVKKEVFAASDFLLTQEVATKMAWTAHEIDERQAALAEMALKVWSYKL